MRCPIGSCDFRPFARRCPFAVEHTIDTENFQAGKTFADLSRRFSPSIRAAHRHLVWAVEDGSMKTNYPIVIAGDNFGCGSSREVNY